MRLDRIARELATAYFLGKGIATDLPAGAMAFLRSPYAESLPDVQFIFISAPMTAGPYLAPFKQGYQDGFAIRAVLLRPESRGFVRLKSVDPRLGGSARRPAKLATTSATSAEYVTRAAGWGFRYILAP